MKACLLVLAAMLVLAVPTSAKNQKVYVFVAPQGPAGFAVVPQTLKDAANELLWATNAVPDIKETGRRNEAVIVVEVTAREVVDGECRIHAHVTTKTGDVVDLTGSSGSRQSNLPRGFGFGSTSTEHGWADAAKEIAKQLSAWTKAHPEVK